MRLDLVVGPNGAGKSTFVRLTLAPVLPRASFVNADVIAQQRWPDDAEAHSYEAARVAAATREALMARAGAVHRGDRVLSSVEARACSAQRAQPATTRRSTSSWCPRQLAVARVAARVAAGGHAVPEEKIRGRYRRLWPLVADAIELADAATVYDNSQRKGPHAVAVFSHGFAVGNPLWPTWAPDALTIRWPLT